MRGKNIRRLTRWYDKKYKGVGYSKKRTFNPREYSIAQMKRRDVAARGRDVKKRWHDKNFGYKRKRYFKRSFT